MDIEIIVEGEGLADVETIRIPEGSTAREIVAAVALQGGFPTEEGNLFEEDGEEPMDLAAVVAEEKVSGSPASVSKRQIVIAGAPFLSSCYRSGLLLNL